MIGSQAAHAAFVHGGLDDIVEDVVGMFARCAAFSADRTNYKGGFGLHRNRARGQSRKVNFRAIISNGTAVWIYWVRVSKLVRLRSHDRQEILATAKVK